MLVLSICEWDKPSMDGCRRCDKRRKKRKGKKRKEEEGRGKGRGSKRKEEEKEEEESDRHPEPGKADQDLPGGVPAQWMPPVLSIPNKVDSKYTQTLCKYTIAYCHSINHLKGRIPPQAVIYLDH
jgi:hypothetical protein